MRIAVPEQPRLSWALFGLTLLVWVGSVYSRYHYAVDGLAAAGITGIAVGLQALGSRLRAPGPKKGVGSLFPEFQGKRLPTSF